MGGIGLTASTRHFVLVAVLPLLHLAINPHLFMTPAYPDLIDSWVYTGFFMSLPDHIRRFGETYYGSRLPWVLPGFALYHLFTPVTANYVLHIGFFYLLLAATYGLIASGANRSIAMIGTILVAGSPAVLTPFSWDYIDGPESTFLVCALFCLERYAGGGRSRQLWAAGAGAAMAAIIATNLALAVLLPVCMAFLLVRVGARQWRTFFMVMPVATIGAAILLLGLGFAYHRLGGNWLFLSSSLAIGRALATQANPWRAPGLLWMFNAPWLVLPATAAVGAVVTLVARARTLSPVSRAMQVTAVTALAVWLALDSWSTAFLQLAHYTTYIAVLMLIAVALQFEQPEDQKQRDGRFLWYELAALSAVAVTHYSLLRSPVHTWQQMKTVTDFLVPIGSFHRLFPVDVGPLGAAFAALTAVLLLRTNATRPVRWVGFTLLFTVSFVAAPPFWPSADVRSPVPWFDHTVSAHRFIAQYVGSRRLRFWYSSDAHPGLPSRSIVSTYLFAYVLVNEHLPTLSDEERGLLSPGLSLVLVVGDETEAVAARNALRRVGRDYVIRAQQRFGLGEDSFAVLVADVIPTVPAAN